MQREQRNSFFQVNINAQKFNIFTTSLNSILNSQQKQIQQNAKQLAQIKLMIDQKLSRMKLESDYQLQKVNKKLKEEVQYQSSMESDFKTKQQEIIQECISKMFLLQEQVSLIHGKFNQSFIQNSQLAGKLEQNEVKNQKDMEIAMEKIKLMQNEIKNSINVNQTFFQNILHTYDKGSHENGNNNGNNNSKNITLIPRKIVKQSKTQQTTTAIITPKEPIQEQNLKQQKRKKTQHQKSQNENLKYASISAKIQSLEERLKAKDNQKLNISMMARRKADFTTTNQCSKINSTGNISTFQKINNQKSVTFKLQHIENIIEQNRQNIGNQITNLDISMQKLVSQMTLLQRKVERQKNKISEIALQARIYEQKKLDQRGVQAVIGTFRKQLRNLEDDLQCKVNNDVFTKQKNRVENKLANTLQMVLKKAQKQQIKRAFQFIQNKIKEVVTLLAEEIHQEKQGAAKRIPFKCLSCDKGLDSTSLPVTFRANTEKKPTSRCPTTKIRKRIIMSNDIQKCID